jgi:hypothetical protein
VKSIHLLVTGFSFLALSFVVPILIHKFGTDPRNPDLAGVGACCSLFPLAILSLLFIIVGITRLINERANKNMPNIIPSDR